MPVNYSVSLDADMVAKPLEAHGLNALAFRKLVDDFGDKSYCYLFIEWNGDEIVTSGRCDDISETAAYIFTLN